MAIRGVSGPHDQRPAPGRQPGPTTGHGHAQTGNQHDTFELERIFAELCDLLEAAELRLEGLFLNADKAFDVTALRQAYARRGIEANIPRNCRSADWQTGDDTPLDPERYRRRLAIERLNA